jgi:hypothetical protein
LDSNAPDLFGQSPFVSETPSAKPSCESTGPMSRSTTTLEPSMQMDIEELTSSAAAFHVNRGPQPGSSEAQKMTATSGRSWLPLLQTYGLNGSLARMCEALLTSRWASSAVFLTWKASGIKPRHLLFQLAPSMPRTDATEFGSSPRKMTPTPTASDHIERNSTSSEKLNPLTGKSVSLDRFVKFWPDAETQASGTPQMWPTPTGQDNPQVRGVGKTVGTKRGTTLGGAVRMWPTPAAHEARLGYQDRTRGKKGTQKSLTTEVIDDMGGRQATIGQLNPTWVEWLMGFPIGHTDLGHWETPSSRKSSRKSDAQSSRQRARNVR